MLADGSKDIVDFDQFNTAQNVLDYSTLPNYNIAKIVFHYFTAVFQTKSPFIIEVIRVDYRPSNSKRNKLIIGIISSVVVLILLIVGISLLIHRSRKRANTAAYRNINRLNNSQNHPISGRNIINYNVDYLSNYSASGLSAEQFHINTVYYQKTTKLPSIIAEQVGIGDKCTFCFEEFKDNEQVYKSYCNHLFHCSCLNEYFAKLLVNSIPKCPNCNLMFKIKK